MPVKLTSWILWRRRKLDRNLLFRRLVHGRDPETGECWIWRTPGFAAHPARFVVQSGLATVVMLVALIFVDSLSNAAIAAGLASSVVIIFVNPSNRTARIRSVVGGARTGVGVRFRLLAPPIFRAGRRILGRS